MAKTYTVKWGDTLSQIAKDNGTTWQKLQKINNIPNADYIVVGQVIKLTDDGSNSSAAKATTQQVNITAFGLKTGADLDSNQRTVRVFWSWSRANTDHFTLEWSQYIGGGWRYETVDSDTTYADYTTDPAATSVRVRIKPVSAKYTNSAGKEVSYWTNVSWTSRKSYSFSNNPPLAPSSAPTVKIEGTTLTASLEGLSSTNASIIEFDISKNDSPSYKKKKVSINKVSTVSAEFTVDVGGRYRVRARSWKSERTSNWTEWSSEHFTIPATPEITKCMAGSDDKSIELEWKTVGNNIEYTIEYATSQQYFGNPADSQPYSHTCTSEQNETCTAIISDNVEKEKNYFIRIKAKNSVGDSGWSDIAQTNVGDGPAAPTTFSSTLTAAVGDLITLNWTHNSSSESPAKYSHLDLYVDGQKKLVPTIVHDDGDTYESDREKSYTINTTAETNDEDEETYDIICPNGAVLQWRVRTASEDGILGEWSVLRTVMIYNEPVLSFRAYEDTTNPFTVTSFPLKFDAEVDAGENQEIVGYHLAITANTRHETVNNFGETVWVEAGDVVYAKNFDTFELDGNNRFLIDISAGDVNLTNDVSYNVVCTAMMSSGLSAESMLTFNVNLAESEAILDAEICIDTDSYTAEIRPYCQDTSGTALQNIELSVYRREYDGGYTLISDKIDNSLNVFVTDPHPALDYARYRIVSTNTVTGATHYCDIPGYKVGCNSVIVQWDEAWKNFDSDEVTDDVPWNGSLLKLPYNIDISSKYSPDVSLVEYIGRENPVGYYGTQRGEGGTWNVVIPADDKDTIYALRRLARWMDNVYVREPSGIGYWANVIVTFSKKHRDLTIPVTLNITKVEGGA